MPISESATIQWSAMQDMPKKAFNYQFDDAYPPSVSERMI